jgi:hypothetical protein
MTDLRGVLRTLGIPFWESGQSSLVTSGWYGIKCPYCDNGKNKPGLGVHARTLKTSCWRCGPRGLAKALADASGQPYRVVRELLGGVVPEQPLDPVKGKLVLPDGLEPLGPLHRDYLAGRGFDPDHVAELWGLKGIGSGHGVMSWRVYIPIRNAQGQQVSWTTRAIGDKIPHGLRYRGASAEQSLVPRSECLFGIEHVRSSCVVCEGQMDVIAVGPGAVCTAGVGFSRAQILTIAEIPTRCIVFDSEPSAQKRAKELASRLSLYDGETHIATVSGPDPASSPKEDLQELRSLFLEQL